VSDQLHRWVDRRVVDPAGDLVGVVVDVYADADSGESCWLAISSGYFGTRVLVAPAAGASNRGSDVVIAHSRARVETAPTVHPVAALSGRDEQALRAHFGRARRHHHHPPTPTGRTTR
jgi:hypothetical protein